MSTPRGVAAARGRRCRRCRHRTGPSRGSASLIAADPVARLPCPLGRSAKNPVRPLKTRYNPLKTVSAERRGPVTGFTEFFFLASSNHGRWYRGLGTLVRARQRGVPVGRTDLVIPLERTGEKKKKVEKNYRCSTTAGRNKSKPANDGGWRRRIERERDRRGTAVAAATPLVGRRPADARVVDHDVQLLRNSSTDTPSVVTDASMTITGFYRVFFFVCLPARTRWDRLT